MPADPVRPPLRRRLRRGLAVAVALVGATVAINVGGSLAAAQEEPEESASDAVLRFGQEVFGARCALCHGEEGRGLPDDGGPAWGPSLLGVGPASVDFMVRTGRMPLDNANERLRHREQILTDAERVAVVTYVESLAPEMEGPEIPDVSGYEHADLSRGLELFTTNCAACHGATAGGIAVGQRDVSSNLDIATPLEIAEAIRTGPGVMPVFNDEVLPQEDLEAVVAWVMDLRDRQAPGGASIGRSGPVSEGFIAWVLGLGSLMIVMYLLGEKAHGDDDAEA